MSTPVSGDPAPSNRAGRSRVVRLFVQLGGFAAGIALLAWCVSLALSPDNRAQLDRLREATPGQIAALLALSLASLFLNGIIMHLTIAPVRALRRWDVCAINGLAAFLGYLPLKLGFFLRVAIHIRRDRIPLLMVGAWFAAVAIPLLGTAGCLALATLLTREIDARWYAVAATSLVLGSLTVVALARLLGGDRGRKRLRTIATRLRLHMIDRFLASESYARLNSATFMLASPRVVFVSVALRVVDFVLQAVRFVIAAKIIGTVMPMSHAFVVASSAFVIGIISPGGPVGAREAGVIGVLKLLGVENPQSLVLVPLLVTATEAVAYMIGAAIGIAWLGPRRLFTPRTA